MDEQEPFDEDAVPGAGLGADSAPEPGPDAVPDAPALGVVLAQSLAAVPAGELDYAGAVRALVQVRQLLAWTEALRARFIDRVCSTAEVAIPAAGGTSPTNRVEASLVHASAVAEIAAALRMSEGAAAGLADTSELLVGSFPSTLESMEAGQLSAAHAAVIVDEASSIPRAARAGFEERMLAAAPGLTRAEFASRARRARERAHPETITIRRGRAACDRRVQYEPGRDGMAWLGAYLPAEAAVSGFNRITSAARSLQGPAEERTLTQLRADVFTDLLINAGVRTGTERLHTLEHGPSRGNCDGNCGGTNNAGPGGNGSSSPDCLDCVECSECCGGGSNPLSGSVSGRCPAAEVAGQLCGNRACRECNWPDPAELETHHGPSEATAPYYEGIRAQVLVTVPVFSLMGLSDEPAELEGYGPIPADVARQLAAGAESFTRILTHPESGAMLSFGRDTYKVPAHLKRAVRVRDPYCEFIGCRTSAEHCEMDHVLDWFPVGETSYLNVKPGCKKHHRIKHHGAWKVEPGRQGVLHWQSPAGLKYDAAPEGHVLGAADPHHRPNEVLRPYFDARQQTSNEDETGSEEIPTDEGSPPHTPTGAPPPF